MPTSYPFRVAVWRRVLQSNAGVVRWFTLTVPALLGALLLLVAIPAISSLLETETRLLKSGENRLKVQTDCQDLRLSVLLHPSDYQSVYEKPLEVGPGQLAIFMEAFGHLLQSPETFVSVALEKARPDPRCDFADVSVVSFTGDEPTLMNGRRTVEEIGATKFRANLRDTSKVSFLIRWPGLYHYSHEGFGWFNRAVGRISAGASFFLAWEGLPPVSDQLGLPTDPTTTTPVSMDARVEILSPGDYEVSHVRDFLEIDRRQHGVTYFNRHSSPDFLESAVRFRARSYEGKMHYLLLAGGSIVGLGITLLVESLIAVLFRFGRILSGPEKKNSELVRGIRGARFSKPRRQRQKRRRHRPGRVDSEPPLNAS